MVKKKIINKEAWNIFSVSEMLKSASWKRVPIWMG